MLNLQLMFCELGPKNEMAKCAVSWDFAAGYQVLGIIH